jgi:putative FmdB family regulatory protein
MPIYEYACGRCGHAMEARQSMKDPALTHCPNCGQETLERVVSHSTFALKGAGWYADGYGASGGDKSEKKKSEVKPAETPKAEPAPAAPAPEKKSGD